MFETFRAASCKAKLLNIAIFVFLFSTLAGCGVSFFGVLQEGTLDDADSTIWQFFWQGVQEGIDGPWVLYRDYPGSVGSRCSTGGKALLALSVVILGCVAYAFALCVVRISGAHVEKLQPPSKWIRREFKCTASATGLQALAVIIWSAACYDASAKEKGMASMVPTGLMWLILCIVWLGASTAGYVLIRKHPHAFQLGSSYGAELSTRNDPIVEPASPYQIEDREQLY